MPSPLPQFLFVNRSEVSWANRKGYPVIGDTNPRRWAWEFLRRNARYAATIETLPENPDSIKNYRERESAFRLVDEACLAWQIDEALHPRTTWDQIPLHWRNSLFGVNEPKEFAPILNSAQPLTDYEVVPTSLVRVPATQTQLLVRVSLSDSPARQAQRVKKILEEFRKRLLVQTTSGQAHHASYHDRASASGRARLMIPDTEDPGQSKMVETVVVRRNTRVRPRFLHFILRTVDALAAEHNPDRSALVVDELGLEDIGIPMKRLREQWLEFPFGKASDEWVRPLSKTLANAFNKESEFTSGDELPVITPEMVRGWMRYGRELTLEQGYAQLAATSSLERATSNDE